jgi:hypothetical protein
MNTEDLQETDKGRWVAYTPRGQPHGCDLGRIKSWNGVYVFVAFAFTRRPHWDIGPGERAAMACLPDTLSFVEPRPEWKEVA